MKLICPTCKHENNPWARACVKCGTVLPLINIPSSNSESVIELNSKKQLLGLLGSIILFIGVFTPIVSVPVIGNINYFQNGKGDGTIIMVLAIISFALTLLKKYNWLWLTGCSSLGITIYAFFNFQNMMTQARIDMNNQLAGNPFKGLAEMTLQTIQIQWGWALLVVGAALIVISAAIKGES